MRKAIILSVLLYAATAAAEHSPEADAHARRGFALYNLGKYGEAIAAFESAYTLVPSDALLFNLAQAHRQLDHCEVALSYYKRFMAGSPPRHLASQVEDLLPKLETACQTKFEQPAGPVAAPEVAVNEPVEEIENDVEVHEPPEPTVLLSAGVTAGTLISGGSAPTTGVKLIATTPRTWFRGAEVGVTLGAARLWRGDVQDNALLTQVAATVRKDMAFGWGHITLGGELGAVHVSRLDHEHGVLSGNTRSSQWLAVGRAELGVEYDLGRSFALRAATAIGYMPRTGTMLVSAAHADAIVGIRYVR